MSLLEKIPINWGIIQQLNYLYPDLEDSLNLLEVERILFSPYNYDIDYNKTLASIFYVGKDSLDRKNYIVDDTFSVIEGYLAGSLWIEIGMIYYQLLTGIGSS